jgi:hypothetical protein
LYELLGGDNLGFHSFPESHFNIFRDAAILIQVNPSGEGSHVVWQALEYDGQEPCLDSGNPGFEDRPLAVFNAVRACLRIIPTDIPMVKVGLAGKS